MFLVFQCKNIAVSVGLCLVWFQQTLHAPQIHVTSHADLPPSCREVSVDVELQSRAPGTCQGSVQFKDT